MPNPRTKRIQSRLLNWYDKNQRNLPWRKTKNPYNILVSEVMLQQTQVDRVIPKYKAWLKAFPTAAALAKAPLTKVLRHWSGLGYNRRAVNLRAAAAIITNEYHGKFPETFEELKRLPGVGEYTAKAVMAFAFKQPVAMIDTNVRRVVSRAQFGLNGPVDSAKLQTAADQLVPPDRPDAWHHAVMDLGAMVCVSRRPKCEVCPLREICRAYPAILQNPQTVGRKQAAFRDSDRFWRGRMVAIAIQAPMTLTAFRRQLAKYGSLPPKRYHRLLEILQSEGLLTVRSGRVQIKSS